MTSNKRTSLEPSLVSQRLQKICSSREYLLRCSVFTFILLSSHLVEGKVVQLEQLGYWGEGATRRRDVRLAFRARVGLRLIFHVVQKKSTHVYYFVFSAGLK